MEHTPPAPSRAALRGFVDASALLTVIRELAAVDEPSEAVATNLVSVALPLSEPPGDDSSFDDCGQLILRAASAATATATVTWALVEALRVALPEHAERIDRVVDAFLLDFGARAADRFDSAAPA